MKNDNTIHAKPLSSVVSQIEVSAIKRIQLLANTKKDVISLAQGTPSFFTPQHIKKAAIDAINQNLSEPKDNLTLRYRPNISVVTLVFRYLSIYISLVALLFC